MHYSINIKFLTIVIPFFLIGINKSFLHHVQKPNRQSNFTPLNTANKIDSSPSILCIDSLKLGQDYFINVQSNGCFHKSNLSLVISKETNGYFASFKMKGNIENKKINTTFKKTQLTDYQINSVRNFERQLISVSASHFICTTVDVYTLSIDKLSKIYTVNKCDWQGIGKLVEVLFHNTK